MSNEQPDAFLRLPQVISRLAISRSLWWKGVKQGQYPSGIKLSPRVTVWRRSDIDTLIRSLNK